MFPQQSNPCDLSADVDGFNPKLPEKTKTNLWGRVRSKCMAKFIRVKGDFFKTKHRKQKNTNFSMIGARRK